MDKIDKSTGGSNSELFRINKAINFEERKIPELEFALTSLKLSSSETLKEEKIRLLKINIEEHKKTLEKLKNKVANIERKLDEEN